MNEFYKALTNPKGKYGVWGIVAVICLGVALMVVPGFFLDADPVLPPISDALTNNGSGGNYALGELEKEIAGQIREILSQVQGAGAVLVGSRRVA